MRIEDDSVPDQRGKVPAAKEGQSEAASRDSFKSKKQVSQLNLKIEQSPTTTSEESSAKLPKLLKLVKSRSLLLLSCWDGDGGDGRG